MVIGLNVLVEHGVKCYGKGGCRLSAIRMLSVDHRQRVSKRGA